MQSRLAFAGGAFVGQVHDVIATGRLDETFVDALAAHRRTLVAGALTSAGIGDLGAGDPMRWVAQTA